MRKPITVLGIMMAIALVAGLVGCGGSGSSGSSPQAATGTLQLVVSRQESQQSRDSRAARAVPSSATAVRVTVVGTSLTSTTPFPSGTSTLTVTVGSVPVGQQTVLVEALASSTVVASGQGVVTVVANASASVTITLTPVSSAALSVTSVTPVAGPTTGADVIIRGTGFATTGTVTVRFGSGQATGVSVVDDTTLSCTAPAGAVGAVDLAVTNPDQSQVTLAGAYSYYADTAVIMTVVGTGSGGFSGDGGPSRAALVNFPYDVQVDSSGSLLFVDTHNYRLRKIDAHSGLVSTFCGNGTASATGDGGAAAAATVNPVALALGPGGDMYIMDSGTGTQRKLRRITAATGVINLVQDLTSLSTTLLGICVSSTGTVYMSRWHSPATVYARSPAGVITTLSTQLSALRSVALSPDETVLYASNQNDFDISSEGHKVKKITLATNALADFAGTGVASFSGDGGPALSATLDTPWFVCTDPSGNVYIADRGNGRIRKVDAATQVITTIAGDGSPVTSPDYPNPRGDGGNPLNAQLGPLGALCWANGDLYFSEVDANKIRRITNGANPTSVSPVSGPAGTTVTITGTNFKPGAAVLFNGVPSSSVQVTSATQLTCTVPALGLGAATLMPVAVRNQGTPKTVLGQAYTFTP